MRTLLSLGTLLLIGALTAVIVLAVGYHDSHHSRQTPMSSDDYAAQWKKVEEALGKGLPKSALEIVEKIYASAKAEANRPQIIKATAYRVALIAETNEEGEVMLIRDVEKEIAGSRQPVTAIFQSMLADLYWNYYRSHRWQIRQRTETGEAAEEDFRTWDPVKFFEKTRLLYLASLEPAADLQKIPVAEYREILVKRSESELYRPTMFDILAHRALDFFENDEADIPKPAREFEVTGLEALAPATDFAAHPFQTPDAADPKYHALALYQKLLQFHLSDPAPDALVDLDLQRLQYARRVTFNEDKDTTFFIRLGELLKRYRDASISTQIGYEMARYEFDRGDYVKAMALCDGETGRFKGSRGAVNCASLRSQILAKDLDLNIEKSVPPDAPFLMSVNYRNVDKIYCRILPRPEDDDEEEYYSYRRSIDDWLKELLKKKPLQSWQQSLPKRADYAAHRVDLKAPAMPLGSYILLVSPSEQFPLEKNAVVYANLSVTRLSLQSRTLRDGGMRFWVQDAEGGAPLGDVTVSVFIRRWNSPANKYERTLLKTLRSDAQGSFALETGSYDGDLFLKLKNKNDEYAVGQSFHPWERGKSGEQLRTIFFTDRSLYRPGQTVFFKGIVFKADDDRAEYGVASKTNTTVQFLDANYQKIADHDFTTNEYGSFSGSFTVPGGVLTGMFTIRDTWGSQTIRVEEYKRPKFEVEFQPVKGTFRLNDTISVAGTAKAYAGSNIDGAEVKYRVVRQARFPYWWWWWRPMPGGGDKEIAHGVSRTDEKGEFRISFPALPDKSIARKDLPVFDYAVTADVTDINGETRSGTASVSVGYTALSLGIGVEPLLDRKARNTLAIRTSNLGGDPVKASGRIVVEKLSEPRELLRSRFLPKADQYAMTEAEFRKAFPHDVYREEDNQDSWKIAEKVLDRSFSTDEAGVDSISLSDLTPGLFRITVTSRDPGGETIEIKRFVTVYDRAARALPLRKTALLIPLKTTCLPGEKAGFLYGSSLDGARVLYQIEHRGEIVKEEWLTLDDEQRLFEVPIEETDRGGITVHFLMVSAYRVYAEDAYVSVPWSNKELRVQTATFRDKLKPGQQEEWRLTISGEKADHVAAEMVATMYDASLDAIWRGSWPGFSRPAFYGSGANSYTFGQRASMTYNRDWYDILSGYPLSYDALNLFLLSRMSYGYGRGFYGAQMMKAGALRNEAVAGVPAPMMAADAVAETDGKERRAEKKDKNGMPGEAVPPAPPKEDVGQVKARTNFNETAFFFPQLMTNEKGEIVLSFTMPEALTRWRMIAFAHTPDMKTGAIEKSVITQKELMVMPNMPRFFREGDQIVLPAKITNLADRPLTGTAKLLLFDAVSMRAVDAQFALSAADRDFTVEKGRSVSVSWRVTIPEGLSAVVYRIVAKSGEFSDGEEAPLAILPNRMLVTETLPLNIRGNQTRSYTFTKLVNSAGSPTLRHNKLTLEMTSNPAWYAVQALPYLMEFPHECAEQLFNRFYANSIASHLVNANPKIKRVFDQWKGTDALLSNLQKNQDLKGVLLQETPWVMQGQNENERKQRIGLLFDLNTMANNLDDALRKLEKAQGGNGGFAWFPGMPESRYITQYILAGFGHLKALGIAADDARIARMTERAVAYMDARMAEDYDRLKHSPGFNPKLDYLGYTEVQYLYARSYFLNQKIAREHQEAVDFWKQQARAFWVSRNFMSQGMIALALFRWDDPKSANAVIASLRERSLHSDEMGTYWKYDSGWFWYQAPVETQALLIEAFDEIANDQTAIDEMKIWLLKQKQVQDWKTTVATAEACYALLRRGSDLLVSDKLVEVTVGGEKIDPRKDGGAVEAGTGYYRLSWNGREIRPDMGSVTLKKNDAGIAWGAMYWQYYEQLDKITPHKTPLQIEKKLYKQVTTDKGIVLEPITEKNLLRVGDILKARIEIRVDRDMEYIHLKDMRGAGFELVNQISVYRWQGGLGYYEAPRDASVNFFIYWMPKGVYVFEYPLRVSHEGLFSNGISTIQSMYAPEFASHTQGFTLQVK